MAEAHCPTFINADVIAAELAPSAPESVAARAARIMVQRMRAAAQTGASFAFETTLANRGYAHSIRAWQRDGYYVSIWFLALPSAELSVARVAQRVRQGGHGIPEDVIRRRFAAGRANFDQIYRDLADAWALYDNSGMVPLLLDSNQKR